MVLVWAGFGGDAQRRGLSRCQEGGGLMIRASELE